MTYQTRHEFRLSELGEPISHYTDAVAFGGFLFVSGCIGVDHARDTIASDVTQQTRQIFENMRQILSAADANIADILKVTVFLTDMDDRSIINSIREEFFGSHRPASTLVEISRLAREGAKVEIEAIVGLPALPSQA